MKLRKTNMGEKGAQDYLRKVETPVGIFTIFFPYGVFNPEDNMNKIPQAVRDFKFLTPPISATSEEIRLVADANARHLQQRLNEVICFNTKYPQFHVEVLYGVRQVHVC